MFGGEGGIRTHGTFTRTTVFEFYDSHAGACRVVAKPALLFAIFPVTMLPSDAPCHTVPRGSFANPFANFPPARVRWPRRSGLRHSCAETAGLREGSHAVQASVGLSVYRCSCRLKRVRRLTLNLVHCLEKCLGTF